MFRWIMLEQDLAHSVSFYYDDDLVKVNLTLLTSFSDLEKEKNLN